MWPVGAPPLALFYSEMRSKYKPRYHHKTHNAQRMRWGGRACMCKAISEDHAREGQHSRNEEDGRERGSRAAVAPRGANERKRRSRLSTAGLCALVRHIPGGSRQTRKNINDKAEHGGRTTSCGSTLRLTTVLHSVSSRGMHSHTHTHAQISLCATVSHPTVTHRQARHARSHLASCPVSTTLPPTVACGT